MENHVTAVGALHIGMSILGLIIGAIAFVFLTAIGFISHDDQALLVLGTIGTIAGVFFFVISVPGIIGGIGLLKRREWARILILVVSALELFNFPFGTALGVYSMWVLVNSETVRLFSPDASKP